MTRSAFSSNQFEVYFYCLGCLPPLLFNSYFLITEDKVTDWVMSYDEMIDEIKKLGLVKQFATDLQTLNSQKSPEMRYCSPLLLALKALAASDPSVKKELQSQTEVLMTILRVTYQC